MCYTVLPLRQYSEYGKKMIMTKWSWSDYLDLLPEMVHILEQLRQRPRGGGICHCYSVFHLSVYQHMCVHCALYAHTDIQ